MKKKKTVESVDKFQQMLEYLVNEDQAKAEELFHEIVVEKSRNIYENLLAEEEDEVEEADDDDDDDEDVEEGYYAEADDDDEDDDDKDEDDDDDDDKKKTSLCMKTRKKMSKSPMKTM